MEASESGHRNASTTTRAMAVEESGGTSISVTLRAREGGRGLVRMDDRERYRFPRYAPIVTYDVSEPDWPAPARGGRCSQDRPIAGRRGRARGDARRMRRPRGDAEEQLESVRRLDRDACSRVALSPKIIRIWERASRGARRWGQGRLRVVPSSRELLLVLGQELADELLERLRHREIGTFWRVRRTSLRGRCRLATTPALRATWRVTTFQRPRSRPREVGARAGRRALEGFVARRISSSRP